MDDDDEELPNAICKLMNSSSVRITNLSGNEYGNNYDQIIDDDDDDEISSDEESLLILLQQIITVLLMFVICL